jgi:hypothetical protein
MASRELARALVASTPSGCEVAAIVPSGADVAGTVEGAVPIVLDERREQRRRVDHPAPDPGRDTELP